MKKSNDWKIIHRYEDWLFCYKPAGMPTQDDHTQDPSLLSCAEAHFSQPLHLCNRLDRPVSGIVIIANHPNGQTAFRQNAWFKKYVAIVEKNPDKPLAAAGDIEGYIMHDKKRRKARFISHTGEANLYKPCALHYQVLSTLDRYYVLDISLRYGRFHQIRASLAAIGVPIKGDVKYGARRANRDRNIYLHNYTVQVLDIPLEVNCPIPNTDDKLWGLASEALG